MKRWMVYTVLFIVLLALVACSSEGSEESDNGEENPSLSGNEHEGNTKDQIVPLAITLKNNKGEKIGTADLEQQFEGVKITLTASNLTPGEHGFHIHEKGTCKEPDFKSAGGHFNPTDASHGTNHDKGPHAGDLPNLNVNDDGMVQEEILAEQVTLKSGEENSLISKQGTALVIHEGEDDKTSQPSGDAGKRVACGVISEQK